MTVIRNRSGEKIRTVADWGRVAGPAMAKQWNRRHRSFAFADHWTSGAAEPELATAFEGSAELSGFVPQRAVALGHARYDEFGGPCQHDLVVHGDAASGSAVIAIELVDEDGLGETVDDHDAAASAERESGPKTREPERLEHLLAAICGATLADRPELGEVRWRLLSATAGALVQAAKAQSAVLLVHEFVGLEPDTAKHEALDADVARFLELVFNAEMPEGRHWLVGPFRVSGSDRVPADRDFYVARLTTDIVPDEPED